jgi:hypothetical protein
VVEVQVRIHDDIDLFGLDAKGVEVRQEVALLEGSSCRGGAGFVTDSGLDQDELA